MGSIASDCLPTRFVLVPCPKCDSVAPLYRTETQAMEYADHLVLPDLSCATVPLYRIHSLYILSVLMTHEGDMEPIDPLAGTTVVVGCS